MANQWLRLWHDMPTDPKWRTVAKASGQRIGDVMAVYLHLLVCASNATERGRTQSFNCEDVASALDLDTEQVVSIVDAMQGRVLDGDQVKGWKKRQVAREDGAAERAKAWRDAKKAESNAAERNRTQSERNQTPDKDTDKTREEEKEKERAPKAPPFDPLAVDLPSWLPAETWQSWVKHRGSIRKPIKTPDTVAACFKSLEAFVRDGVSVESVVTHAIASGNQGLYAPPRMRGHGPPAGSDRKSRQLETAALMTGTTRAEQPTEFIDVPSRLIPS